VHKKLMMWLLVYVAVGMWVYALAKEPGFLGRYLLSSRRPPPTSEGCVAR